MYQTKTDCFSSALNRDESVDCAPRALTVAEQDAVNGGVLPALMLAGAYVGHAGILGASGGTISMGVGFAAHVISGIGLGYAAYSLGTAYGGGGGKTYNIGEQQR